MVVPAGGTNRGSQILLSADAQADPIAVPQGRFGCLPEAAQSIGNLMTGSS